VQQPLTWYLNQKYLPTQFPEAMLVNPYTAATLPQDQLFRAMNLLGYSNDKIQAFITMHQKRLTVPDVKLLLDNKLWDETAAETYITNLGYPAALAPTVLLVHELQEERAWIDKLVSELEAEVKKGTLTLDEFDTLITGLPYSDGVQTIIKGTAAYKVKAAIGAKVHHLGEGELVAGFEAGLLTPSDLEARWTLQGLSDADQQVRMALILLRLKHITDVEAFKSAGFAQKQAAYAAKALGSKAPVAPPIKPVPPFPLG
jgi:hypothetical protein